MKESLMLSATCAPTFQVVPPHVALGVAQLLLTPLLVCCLCLLGPCPHLHMHYQGHDATNQVCTVVVTARMAGT